MTDRILVTGASGFIGGYVVDSLKKHGYDVVRLTHEQVDLCSEDIPITANDVQAVIHLAGKTFVPESWEDPQRFIEDNVEMTLRVLEFCRRMNAKLVFPSTYMYGVPRYLPIDETHPCEAITPYHLSKKIGEELCEFYSKNYGIPTAVVRPFNVYGYGQKDVFLIPKVFRQVSDENVDLIEVLDLSPKRDYIYVDDLAEIIVAMIDRIRGFDIFNIGSGFSYSVNEVIQTIQNEYGTNKLVRESRSRRRNEVQDCISDNSKIIKLLGDIHITGLEEGIHKWRLMEEGMV